jgi:hypothetical protein
MTEARSDSSCVDATSGAYPPWLLPVWAAISALILWDAWTGATRPEAKGDGSDR